MVIRRLWQSVVYLDLIYLWPRTSSLLRESRILEAEEAPWWHKSVQTISLGKYRYPSRYLCAHSSRSSLEVRKQWVGKLLSQQRPKFLWEHYFGRSLRMLWRKRVRRIPENISAWFLCPVFDMSFGILCLHLDHLAPKLSLHSLKQYQTTSRPGLHLWQ